MSDPHTERMDVISEALARLERRNAEILRRLERLEAAAGLPVAPVEETATAESAAVAVSPAPETSAQGPPRRFETRMGLTLVNRVGVVTLVLGAAFFFRYAVEAGWLGVTARVLVGDRKSVV